MIQAPCYDVKNRADCPNRSIYCRPTCAKWLSYMSAKAKERELKDRQRLQAEALDSVESARIKRMKKWRHER